MGTTYPAGPNPSGLAVADVNHDGKLDLLVGNGYGDVLVLLGNGDSTFQPYHPTDRDVALAVLPSAGPASTPEFVFSNQDLDHVVVATGDQSSVLVDRSEGLLDPGAVQLADLNGDGIADLIVLNSGGNDVLVYPGLGNGQFGAAINDGHGFFTGTDPVGVTIADVDGDGRPDLVVANQGSNDISVLLNQKTSGGGFTLTQGERLKAGVGPKATVVQDVNGDGLADILVSDSGSNDARLLPGLGNGFFNDTTPKIFPVGVDPGPIVVGTFNNSPGLDLVTVNTGSNDITLISDFAGSAPVFQSFATGGSEPVSALAGEFTGENVESLVIANKGDGLVTLLGGPEGFNIEETLSLPALTAPTSLALAAFTGNEVEFYATTEGLEFAFALAFGVFEGSPSAASTFTPESPAPVTAAILLPLNENSLALIGTLLTVTLVSPPGESFQAASEEQASAIPSVLSGSGSVGQSLFMERNDDGESSDDAESVLAAPPVVQGAKEWAPFVIGVEEAFERLDRESQESLPDAKGTLDAEAGHEEQTAPPAQGPVNDDDQATGSEAIHGASLDVDQRPRALAGQSPLVGPPRPWSPDDPPRCGATPHDGRPENGPQVDRRIERVIDEAMVILATEPWTYPLSRPAPPAEATPPPAAVETPSTLVPGMTYEKSVGACGPLVVMNLFASLAIPPSRPRDERRFFAEGPCSTES